MVYRPAGQLHRPFPAGNGRGQPLEGSRRDGWAELLQPTVWNQDGLERSSVDRSLNTNKIATVDPETMELTSFDLPDERSRPRRLVIDSDDKVWYVDYSLGRLGRLDPLSGDIQEWDNPSGERSRPYAMAIDASDRIWFVETGVQPNKFVGFDPASEEFFSVSEIGSGGGTVRHMFYEEDTNSIWFGADTNTVGQAKLPPLKIRTATDG